MSQALYRKWRPQKWDEVIGQEHIVQTLRNAVAADRIAHAYLFAGPRGTGKTTTARLMAKAANCLEPDLTLRPCDRCDHCLAVNQGRFLDLIEIDAASNTSVDDVRDLRDKINFSPNMGRFKVYIIDEVHMLSTAAFNALLKTLEEPPPHAIFILATTEVHKIPATVLSRCQRHEFRRIPVNEIVRQLKTIAEQENFSVEDDALQLVAQQATGAMRDAISLLDQLAASGTHVTLEIAQDILGTSTSDAVLKLVDAVLHQDAAAGLDHIHLALDAGADPRQFAKQIVEYLRELLLVRVSSSPRLEASMEVRRRMSEQAQVLETPRLLKMIQDFNQAENELRYGWQPALPLELALISSLEDVAQAPGVSRPPTRQVEPQVQAKPAASAAPEQVGVPAALPREPRVDTEFDRIRKQWSAITESLRGKSNATQALLNSCTLLELRGRDLYIGFSTDVVKSKMEDPANLDAANQALEAVTGAPYRIKCVIASGTQDIPEEVENDGMVAAAIRLGGEIVHSRDVSRGKKPAKKQ